MSDKTRPRTMSAERESREREYVRDAHNFGPTLGMLREALLSAYAELDAERAAHDATRAKLAEADAGWTAASAMYGAERDRAEASESLAAEAVRLLRRINDDATPSEPEDGSFAASRERYFAALTESRAFLARADVAALPKGDDRG